MMETVLDPCRPMQVGGCRRAVLAVLWLAAVLVLPAIAGEEVEPSPPASALEEVCVRELRQGYEAVESGDAERALGHYRAAVSSATTDALRVQALLGLGSAYEALGQHERAVPPLQRATALAPEDARVWYTLGAVYESAGMTDDAVEALQTAARLDPALTGVQLDLCVLHSKSGRHAEAVEACRAAGSADPESVSAWTALAVATYHLGRFDEAASLFREALRLDPSSDQAVYGLGLALLFGGDKDGAVEQYVVLKGRDPELARDLYRRIFP